MNRKLIVTLLGLTLAVISWVPLWIVAARDPYAMPVGLGLFAFAGSFVGWLDYTTWCNSACDPRLTGFEGCLVNKTLRVKPSQEGLIFAWFAPL